MVCSNCFSEWNNASHSCPHCGYDPARDAGKYPLALKPGSILNGRYILGRTLGQGGFGITYLAQEADTGKLVAIKEFFPETMVTRTGSHQVTAYTGQRQENFDYGLQCFLSEAQTMAEFLGVETIVQVYSYFEENGTAYFVMEYVEGISLQEHLKSRGGRISWEEAAKILFPVMEALSKVHEKGIIHRDIAPDNIYITKSGKIKLLDFGSARYSLGDKSRSLDVILKHGYAPMEQYSRRGKQGPFTDVYAMAATFYYSLTGQLPPEAVDRVDSDPLVLPEQLGADLPAKASQAIVKGLAMSPGSRWQTMKPFREALDVPVKKPAEVLQMPKAEEPRQKKPFPWIAAAAAVGLVLGAGALLFLPGQKEPEPQQAAVLPAAAVEAVVPETAETTVPAIPYMVLSNTPRHKLLASCRGTAMAIREDGTVGGNFQQTADWENIVSIDADTFSVSNGNHNHAAGLRSDGTVVFTGWLAHPDWDLSQWTDIQAIALGKSRMAGLRADGTLITAGFDEPTRKYLESCTDIADIAIHGGVYAALRKDGTVAAMGGEVAQWTGIVQLSVHTSHIVGLKYDGTVVSTEPELVDDWKDIVAVSAGDGYTMALRSDGTVAFNGSGVRNTDVLQSLQNELPQWENIAAIQAGDLFALGLKADGTLISAGNLTQPEQSGFRVPGELVEAAAEESGLLTGTVQTGPLNVRDIPGVGGSVVGTLEQGDAVTIYETDETGTWGRTDTGWVVLTYIDLDT